VPRSQFFARTQALADIQKVVGDEQTLRLDSSAIAPDLNLVYRVRSPETYDALQVRDYDALYRRLLHPPDIVLDGSHVGILTVPVNPDSAAGLRVLGIRYVTTASVYPFATATFAGSEVPSSTPGTTTLRVAPVVGLARKETRVALVLQSDAITGTM
jgi:hypothetical protein